MEQAYVVAVRRERRAQAEIEPDDWAQQLSAIDGVSVLGRTGHVARILAAPGAVEEVRRRLGGVVHVEPEIVHRPS